MPSWQLKQARELAFGAGSGEYPMLAPGETPLAYIFQPVALMGLRFHSGPASRSPWWGVWQTLQTVFGSVGSVVPSPRGKIVRTVGVVSSPAWAVMVKVSREPATTVIGEEFDRFHNSFQVSVSYARFCCLCSRFLHAVGYQHRVWLNPTRSGPRFQQQTRPTANLSFRIHC